MKSILAIATAGLLLASGAAFAGENCWYGKQQAAMAELEPSPANTPPATDANDPRVLAEAKRRDTADAQPPIHN